MTHVNIYGDNNGRTKDIDFRTHSSDNCSDDRLAVHLSRKWVIMDF